MNQVKPVTKYFIGTIVEDKQQVLGENPPKHHLFYKRGDNEYRYIGKLFGGKSIICSSDKEKRQPSGITINPQVDITCLMTTRQIETYMLGGISEIEAYLLYQDNYLEKEKPKTKIRSKKY